MRSYSLMVLGFSGLIACNASGWTPLDDEPIGDMGKCPPPTLPDLSPPPAKCAAAKGLTGDNLLCIDFAPLPDQQLGATPPQELANWNFNNPPNCWEIKSGKLQIKGFDMFASTCSFTMPQIDLADADKQKYQTITLSLVQKVDLDVSGPPSPNQLAQLYFNNPAIPTYLITQTTGSQPEQQVSFSIEKAKIPSGVGSMVKYVLQVSSGFRQNKQGIQISSIAVTGNQ